MEIPKPLSRRSLTPRRGWISFLGTSGPVGRGSPRGRPPAASSSRVRTRSPEQESPLRLILLRARHQDSTLTSVQKSADKENGQGIDDEDQAKNHTFEG